MKSEHSWGDQKIVVTGLPAFQRMVGRWITDNYEELQKLRDNGWKEDVKDHD